MSIDRYGVQDADGNTRDWQTDDYEEAKAAAQECKMVVIVYEYEYADSYLDDAADFRFEVIEEGA